MSSSNTFSRRGFLSFSALGAAAALSSCASYRSGAPITATPVYGDGIGVPVRAAGYVGSPELDAMYGEVLDNGYLIPAVPYERIDPRFYRQRVADPTGQPPGTIIVDTPRASSTLWNRAARPCATASASAAMASHGRGRASSSGGRNGRNGPRRTK